MESEGDGDETERRVWHRGPVTQVDNPGGFPATIDVYVEQWTATTVDGESDCDTYLSVSRVETIGLLSVRALAAAMVDSVAAVEAAK